MLERSLMTKRYGRSSLQFRDLLALHGQSDRETRADRAVDGLRRGGRAAPRRSERCGCDDARVAGPRASDPSHLLPPLEWSSYERARIRMVRSSKAGTAIRTVETPRTLRSRCARRPTSRSSVSRRGARPCRRCGAPGGRRALGKARATRLRARSGRRVAPRPSARRGGRGRRRRWRGGELVGEVQACRSSPPSPGRSAPRWKVTVSSSALGRDVDDDAARGDVLDGEAERRASDSRR